MLELPRYWHGDSVLKRKFDNFWKSVPRASPENLFIKEYTLWVIYVFYARLEMQGSINEKFHASRTYTFECPVISNERKVEFNDSISWFIEAKDIFIISFTWAYLVWYQCRTQHGQNRRWLTQGKWHPWLCRRKVLPNHRWPSWRTFES